MRRFWFSPNNYANGILWLIGVALQISGWINVTITYILFGIALIWSLSTIIYWIKNKTKIINKYKYKEYYELIPVLQKMEKRMIELAKQEANIKIDFKKYEEINQIVNKDILKIKTPKPKTAKGLKKSVNKLEAVIAEQVKDEVTSIKDGIEKLTPISSFLDAKGFGLKYKRENDKNYNNLVLRLQDFRNLPLGSEISNLISLHKDYSEIGANMLLVQARGLQTKTTNTNIGILDVSSTQMQILMEQYENNMKDVTLKIRDRIVDCIKELEVTMEGKEDPITIKDTKVKLDAQDTEKAIGMNISAPTEINNVSVDMTVKNVKDATGLNVTAVNKEFALRAKTILCSCGNVIHSTTTHGYKPDIVCPKCGRKFVE